MTDTTAAVYMAIEKYSAEHGFPPSVRDLTELCNIPSTSIVKYHLDKLKSMRCITMSPHKARTIKLIKPPSKGKPNTGCVMCGAPVWHGPNGLSMLLDKCETHQREDWAKTGVRKLFEKLDPPIQFVVGGAIEPSEWQQVAEALTRENWALYEEMRRFEAMKSEVLRLWHQQRVVYGKADLTNLFMMALHDVPEVQS